MSCSRYRLPQAVSTAVTLLALALTVAGAHADEPRLTATKPTATEPTAEKPTLPGPWPSWRGPLGTGTSPDADPPISWSESENVRFKVALPGLGHSTPVVWGDHVFLTTAVAGKAVPPRRSGVPGAHDNLAVENRFDFFVLAVHKDDGRLLWQTRVRHDLPHEGGHISASLASASPVTDGERVYAFFGSYGLYALDFDGKIVWKRDLGDMQTKHAHGEGSSPALHGDTLIVNWDHEGQSSLTALDTATGLEKWKVLRDEVTSWASPITVEHGDGVQVIVAGTAMIRGYDLATGRVIWECGGLSANIVATPVAADGFVIAASSYDIRAMLAIRLEGAKGDITGTENVVWSRRTSTPYVPSPLLVGEALYFLRHYQGILTRVIAKTGEEPTGPVRLGPVRNIYASPVSAAGRIYIADRQGATVVLSDAPEPELLSVNHLDDRFSASPALAGDAIFLRGEKYLYSLAAP